MIRLITLLTMIALVAVQFVDVVVLDAAPLEVSAVHLDADHDRSDNPDSFPFDDCASHCGCHAFHHFVSVAQAVEVLPLAGSGQALVHQNDNLKSLNAGPPVPPPLA